MNARRLNVATTKILRNILLSLISEGAKTPHAPNTSVWQTDDFGFTLNYVHRENTRGTDLPNPDKNQH
jgi:hypothetical protein